MKKRMKTTMRMTRGEQPARQIIDQRTDTDMRTWIETDRFSASGVLTHTDYTQTL